jgi:GT2 family glycosyltransferase
LEGLKAISVSIIICTKDRPADLARALASIQASDDVARAAEIVVVEEADAPRALPGVRYIHLPRENRGVGYARNAGVRAATGDVVVFIDDDCEAEKGWADALVRPLRENSGIVGAAGAVMVRDCNRIGYAENILGFPGGGLRFVHQAGGRIIPTRHLATCNCAYRRQTVLDVGGFVEEATIGGEDTLLAERVTERGRCVYVPSAVVYHRPRGRFRAIFRWFIRRGESEILCARKRGMDAPSVRYLVRGSWTVRGIVLAAACLYWPRLVAWLPAGAAFYGAFQLWRARFALAYPRHRAAWWLVPFVKITMDAGNEIGRWKELVRHER